MIHARSEDAVSAVSGAFAGPACSSSSRARTSARRGASQEVRQHGAQQHVTLAGACRSHRERAYTHRYSAWIASQADDTTYTGSCPAPSAASDRGRRW
jgi:hypothetical protein